jgi:glutamate 5-kinase
MCIASGHPLHPLKRIESGARCTWFIPAATPATARKQWIAGALKPAGVLRIDAGAVGALKRGRSLLPAGVTAVTGQFERGDAVDVAEPGGRVIARGLSAYSSADVQRIMGRQSREIEQLVGYRGRDEVVHRDDLVLRKDLEEGAGVTSA